MIFFITHKNKKGQIGNTVKSEYQSELAIPYQTKDLYYVPWFDVYPTYDALQHAIFDCLDKERGDKYYSIKGNLGNVEKEQLIRTIKKYANLNKCLFKLTNNFFALY